LQLLVRDRAIPDFDENVVRFLRCVTSRDFHAPLVEKTCAERERMIRWRSDRLFEPSADYERLEIGLIGGPLSGGELFR
jgi:hypothetical protein